MNVGTQLDRCVTLYKAMQLSSLKAQASVCVCVCSRLVPNTPPGQLGSLHSFHLTLHGNNSRHCGPRGLDQR